MASRPKTFGVSERGSLLKAVLCLFLTALSVACGKNPIDEYMNTPRLSTTQSTLTASKTSLLVGENLTVTLAIKDQKGNLYKSTDPLNVLFYSSGGTATGTFSSTTDNGDGTYKATFTATAAGTPLTVRAKVDSSSFDSATTVSISPIPPSLSASTVTLSAATVASGGQVVATLNAVNTSGGAYTSPGLAVVFSCSGGTSTCSSSTVIDAGNGSYTAALTGLTAGTAATVNVTVGGNALTSTAPTLTVTAGAPATIAVVSGGSQTANAGSALPAPMITIVKDAHGNPVSGATIDWTNTTGTLGAVSSTTNASGNASNTLTTGTTAATGTVTAKIHGTSTSVTFNVAGIPGPATQIVYMTQPTGNVVEGAVLPTQPVLKITDQYNNIVVTGPDSTATVSLALTSGTGTLGGTTSVAAVAGVATFAGISVSTKGTGKVITATKANTTGSGGTTSRTRASSSFTINAPAPGAFTITSAVAGDSNVVLSWGAAVDATSYKVIYGTSTGSYPTTASTNATSPFTITGLTPGTTYYFQVTATNVTGSTNATSEASARPLGAFTITAAKPTSAGTLQLSWAASTGASAYTVKYGTSSGSYGTVFSTNATSPVTVPLLAAGQTYYFMVTATNSSGSLNATAEKIGIPASLALDFTSPTLDPAITFTRASSALRYNSAGVLERVSANVARFDYNPATLSLNGLLIEESRENFLRSSQNFAGSLWTRTSVNAQTAVATAPDGTNTANSLYDDTTAGADHAIESTAIAKNSAALPYTFSIFVKSRQYHAVKLYLRTNSIAEAAVTTCDVSGYGSTSGTSAAGSGWSSAVAAVETLPNGWFRCRLIATTNTESDIAAGVRLVDNSGNDVYDGDGTSGVYVWGAQLEQGANASSYIPSPGLSLQSAQLDQSPWSVARIQTFGSGSVANTNAVLDPEGGNNAEFVAEDTSTNTHYLKNTVTGVAPDQTMTLSFYARKGARDLISASLVNDGATSNAITASYDLTNGTYTVSADGNGAGVTGSIVSVGGGWYRCTLSGQPDTSGDTTAIRLFLRDSSGAQNYTGDGSSGAYFWGVQLDAGSTALAYREIRQGTYRAADIAVVSSLGSWFASAQSSLQTLTRLMQTPGGGAVPTTAAFTDGTSANIMSQTLSSTGAQTNAVVSSTPQTNSFVTFTPAAGPIQITSAFASNDLQTCEAGNAGSSSGAASIPAVSRLYLGSDGSANFLNGWLAQVRYFPIRIPDGTLCEYSQ